MGVIYLAGMTGAGKTTVGRCLASKLGCAFLDLDEEIERIAGTSIIEIFAADGEEVFRDLETASLVNIGETKDAVVALGAGVLERETNLFHVQRIGTIIYLRASIETLFERISAETSKRPLLQDAYTDSDLRSRLSDMLKRREPHYLTASLIVDVDDLQSAETVAERVYNGLNLR
ncbi:shikimate kinase [bacterium]|nr:shikimate kinase [bacterium]